MALTILQTYIPLCSQQNTCKLKVVSQILTAQDINVYIYLKRNVNHIPLKILMAHYALLMADQNCAVVLLNKLNCN